ncbi:hypothetical protein CEXT_227511 [Caerostris extrusa]|uniref:Uncharacterized protein n=1 Tax=Caerostris extrusa TaxID=172846 RepID=A0AAV4WPD6_CAEEX|nr:hypothetical protein CEXT_227511 [Caerostris extrusa]
MSIHFESLTAYSVQCTIVHYMVHLKVPSLFPLNDVPFPHVPADVRVRPRIRVLFPLEGHLLRQPSSANWCLTPIRGGGGENIPSSLPQ